MKSILLIMKTSLLFPLFVVLILSSCTKENSTAFVSSNDFSYQNPSAVQAAAVTNFTPYYWSNLLVANVTPPNNSYINGAGSVTWTGQSGATAYTCNTDCSGLFNKILTQTYGYSGTYFQTWTGATRPLAKHYYNEIVTNDHFTQISAVSQIAQGDMIAIKYPEDLANTGHCLLVVAPPTLRTATAPLVAGTTQYEVSVIDCASSGHGSTDTRFITSSTWEDGVGKGVFRIYVGTGGSIKGYSWSTYSTSTYYDKTQRPLAVGRLIP